MKISWLATSLFIATSSLNTPQVFAFSPSSSLSLSSSIPLKSSVVSRPFIRHHRSSSSSTTSYPSSYRTSQMSMSYSIAVVGATGAVGKEIIGVLQKSSLPVNTLRIFGSERSAGSERDAGKFGTIKVELFDVAKARQCDVVFLAVSGDFALEHARAISEGDDGAVVIDNSSAFRYEKDVPLVVPEINVHTCKSSKLIANPNCTTAIALMALWPLHKLFKLKKVIVSTYQAASGAGQEGMDELIEGTRSVLSGERSVAENKIFAHPLPFNVIPHIDKFQPNGYTKEEMKVVWETRKICDLADDFPVSCSAVRIPTLRAHSEVIVCETELPVDIDAARKAISEAPGIKLVDDVSSNKYPMPLTATGQYDCEVGRLRKNLVFGDHGLEFFVVGDQLLRGAALNAVLIAEDMAKNHWLKAKHP